MDSRGLVLAVLDGLVLCNIFVWSYQVVALVTYPLLMLLFAAVSYDPRSTDMLVPVNAARTLLAAGITYRLRYWGFAYRHEPRNSLPMLGVLAIVALLLLIPGATLYLLSYNA